ncbi:lytic transglycosylase domain-containing protein [uncultured Veillonella sp.]|uniref:lytic transglycosylase domain-containing protein n=1 Tax=uncultured Veillonella sp. TaxID=159268 RepID=UPI0025DFE35D|nr:lytic transglycosylase domain-containing protein [uncultured Veillonella sp.]MDY3973356.1 lytic transglycosylase domain-containing protein [Veillonella caviae]
MRGSTLLALAAVILGMYYAVIGEPYLARMYAYPLEHRELVHAQARANNVPFSLVAAVILAESKFDESAQSAPGAMGLMQLMPDTAHWIAEQMGRPAMTDVDIREPETNIKLGTWYLSYLLKEFKGNEILALAAYNAGRGHVEEWMQTYGWDDQFNRIDEIPFAETREYVNTVLKNKEHYEQLYSDVSVRR